MTRRSTLCFTCMISASAVAVALLFVTNGIVKLGNAPDADGSLALRALALESRAELRALRQAERGVAEGLVELRSLVAASSKASGGASASVAPGDVIEQHIEGKPLYLLKTCPADRPTKEWSCVRRLSASAVASRDPALYGFNATEAAHVPFTDGGRRYRQGDYRTFSDDWEIPTQIRLTWGPGYAMMDMPKGLCPLLQKHYATLKGGASEIEELNERGNDYVIPYRMNWMAPEVEAKVEAAMQPILEKWTKQSLALTSVYGFRTYGRHTFLTHHVDRRDSHVASAILQIGQNVEAGWPVELALASGDAVEAYLQPCQMVLYEVSRIPHGRPMRFNGDSFTLAFVHFKPRMWSRIPCTTIETPGFSDNL